MRDVGAATRMALTMMVMMVFALLACAPAPVGARATVEARAVGEGDVFRAVAPRRALRSLPFMSHSGLSSPTHRHHMSTGVSLELIERIAIDRAIIVTWANFHYFDFAMNWVNHLEALGVKNYIVGAMDEDLYEALRKIDVNSWLMGSKTIDAGAVKRDFGWGTPTFHKMGRDKIRLINDFTKSGVDVLISDIDVAWMRNPIPFFRRYPSADILVSSDNLSNSTHRTERQAQFRVDDEGLQEHPCGGTANIGMMWFRSTKGSQALTDEWVQNLEKDDKLWDQAEFNNLMRRGCQSSPDGSGVGAGYDGKVQLGALPVALFNNGHTFFTQRLPEHLKVKPYALHATFQYEGTPGKRNRIREANQWLGDHDTPEYFEQKFMSYTPRVLADVALDDFAALGHPNTQTKSMPPLKEGDPVLKEHMRMVQHQIKQLYEANAIAKKLGRVLILPPFFCGLDRVWFPHAGVFPGSMLRLPFICPADHVMAIEPYGAKFTQEYREYSFLSNPSMPAGVVTRDNARRVSVPPNGSFLKTRDIPSEYAMCFKSGDTNEEDGDECVPARNREFLAAQSVSLGSDALATLDDVAAALSSVRDVKFIHFETVIGVTTSSQAKTTEQLRMGIFCCRLGSHDFYKVDEVELFEKATAAQLALPSGNATETGDVAANNTVAMMDNATTVMTTLNMTTLNATTIDDVEGVESKVGENESVREMSPTTTTTLDSQVTVSETGAVETVKVAQQKEDEGENEKDADNNDDDDDDDDDDEDKKKDEKKDKEDEDKEEDKKVSDEDEDEDVIKKREKIGVDKAQLKLIKEKLLGDYDDAN